MDTTWLRVFGEVARLGSFTAAATALGYTQSAVSRQIAALETELGAVLFDRLARGVVLTEEGRRLLAHSRAALSHVDAARRELGELRDVHAGRLRVGAFSTANAALVPRAMAAFQAAHPAVRVSLVEGRTPDHVAGLADGTVDVAVVSTYTDRLDALSALDLRRLGTDAILVALPRGHRHARRRRLRLAELAEDTWIAGFPDAERTLFATVAGAGFEPRIDFVVQEWTAKLGCVAAGLGVTLVPALAASALRDDVVLVALDAADAPVRAVYAATPGGRRVPAAVEAFLPFLAEAAEKVLAGG
ncbi:LysR family transcriptional regulator [Phytomonospora endophytica]|uniref:DNA-binding transcriptional LysR family regulator n=1 Tax=Phytomonospora endophytica TaxID=714109 RepID=A0A841FCB4_9ACTN|nr:LysR family transcriptional regulator [Phytomonospora endophytica]MBB6034931.1 DNA-binding transcriptional LysR family regulator [Phytomonospora endophytica]GIG70635.1 LysR family transcriptional regulator [Phytomonospora endophytica]